MILDTGYWILDKRSLLLGDRRTSSAIRRSIPVIQQNKSGFLLKAPRYPRSLSSIQHPASHSQYPASRIEHRRPAAVRGFTLMEILVAIFILALVVTTVLASFNMVFSTSETLEGTAAVFDMGRTCMSRIIRDLDNIFVLERPLYQTPGLDDPPDPYRIQGTLDTLAGERFAKLRFTSRAHVPLGRSNRDGIAEIVYYVQTDPNGGLRLKRADHLYPYPRFEERTTDPVLCENLKALTIEYVDAEGVVVDTWDSDSTKFSSATPAMVAVRLEIVHGNDSYAFSASVGLPMGRGKSG